jgi:aminopeptidase N
MEHPVPFATFAFGPFERHAQMVKWDKGGDPIPVEFSSLPGSYGAVKEDFILAEMDNSLRYFSALFGKYPYPVFSAAFHPFGFGQGMPGLLMIPPADRANKYTYAFIAHETSHQWWGEVVTWRSYRDQWLSEGFAEYSGALYAGLRESIDARNDLINDMRRTLREPPVTPTGVGKGRLVEVGPLILGHRLNTSKTGGAYTTLIYNKGALVLRMLHFLFTNPQTGDDKAFFDMMADFVARHRDGFASTDDFRAVANEHFVRTPIAQKYKMGDLNWFFSQWVYQTGLPSYKVEYRVTDAPDGRAVVSGQVLQENVPESWVMPLPLVMNFGGNQWANGTILAYGPRTPFEIKLPTKPKKVELDPTHWVLSEKTSTESK